MEFVIIAEGIPDAETARDLADRVVVDQSDRWLDASLLTHLRSWCGLDPNREFTSWTSIHDLADEYDIRTLGFLDHTGEPGAVDSGQARKAILLHNRLTRDRNSPAILLIRDLDVQPERQAGLHQAREEARTRAQYQPEEEAPDVIVIGAANPKREAWILNGFEPKSEEEREQLQQERKNLPVDPLTDAHKLKAKSDQAQNSCKRVVQVLTDGDTDRERACWQETDLDLLRERGEHTGLADFLEEVERLIPLFTQRR